MDKSYSIKDAAKILNVSVQTLRRWDKFGRFVAHRRNAGKIRHYFYQENDLEEFLTKDFSALMKISKKWSFSLKPFDVPRKFYCSDKSIFKGRLSRLEFDLQSHPNFSQTFSLIVAITGEIGNNSFDHNLGNWPDLGGIIFAYNIKAGKIILADRGQGVLTTLKQVKPDIINDLEALKIAFTEVISGRAPENRGNGLKFVKEVVQKNNFKLFFQSGDAGLNLSKRNKILKITKMANFLRGCFVIINF